MKVFLMFPDRDFEPAAKLPDHVSDLIQDLELDTLFEAMAQGDELLLNAARHAILSSLNDIQTIQYRQEILKDCLKNPEVVSQVFNISTQSIDIRRRQGIGVFTNYPDGILSNARETLVMFMDLLKALRQIADDHSGQFESRGFRRFFTMIQQELDDDYFKLVSKHLNELKFRSGVLLSAQLGPGNEGTNYILHNSVHNNLSLIKRRLTRKTPIYSYNIHPLDDHGARDLEELKNRGLDLVANAVAQSADHIDSFFNVLRQELAFYLGCLNLADQLAELGEPSGFPEPKENGKPRLSFTGLYDITLALTMKQKVISNDLNADGKELIIITGANQGGKSTFLRSIGLAQLMMQCGMMVPAETFSANLQEQIFTHFKREEDATLKSGKLDEELGRMSDIVDKISGSAMVLFNESFTATNEREGSEIARQITNAFLEKHIKVVFVTHLYEFASNLYEQKLGNTIFLRAERMAGGERTYKVLEGSPLQTSYGKDVYERIFTGENSAVRRAN